jgi:hypothetical protein
VARAGALARQHGPIWRGCGQRTIGLRGSSQSEWRDPSTAGTGHSAGFSPLPAIWSGAFLRLPTTPPHMPSLLPACPPPARLVSARSVAVARAAMRIAAVRAHDIEGLTHPNSAKNWNGGRTSGVSSAKLGALPPRSAVALLTAGETRADGTATLRRRFASLHRRKSAARRTARKMPCTGSQKADC